MDHSKDTNAILMEAFDINDTGVMLWDPNDVLVYINKATQAFISILGGKLNIGIRFSEFTKSMLESKSFTLENYHTREEVRKQARATGDSRDYIILIPDLIRNSVKYQ